LFNPHARCLLDAVTLWIGLEFELKGVWGEHLVTLFSVMNYTFMNDKYWLVKIKQYHFIFNVLTKYFTSRCISFQICSLKTFSIVLNIHRIFWWISHSVQFSLCLDIYLVGFRQSVFQPNMPLSRFCIKSMSSNLRPSYFEFFTFLLTFDPLPPPTPPCIQ